MNKKICCIDNLENLPNDLIDLICSNKDLFNTWFHKDNGIDYIKSDRSIIDQSAEAHEIFVCLRNYLSTCMIRAYHATRIIDSIEIIESGLIPFEVKHYTSRLVRVLSERDISVGTCQLISRKVSDFVEKHGRDTETISLFNSYSLYDEGYDQFTQNYGGETVRFAIENDHPDLFELLCEIGIPVIVFCLVDWDEIVPIYQESYIQTLISAVLSKTILQNDDIEESEVRVNGKIAPSHIERIIKVTADSIKAELSKEG